MRIVEEPIEALQDHGAIPIAFQVKSQFKMELVNHGLSGMRLVEESVASPYIKDYDKEEGPLRWQKRWDLKNWGLIAAFQSAQRIGGAVIAWRTPGVNMLDGRDDLAVLWDLRVHPQYRRQGLGEQLFSAVVTWAKARQCSDLKVETQNINVPACRFYQSQGCELGAINTFAYVDEPEEVQLLWRLKL